MVGPINGGGPEEDFIRRHHKHDVAENQCSSSLVKHIKAPLPLVWSLVRRFDQPQRYKPFVSRCIAQGDLRIGTVREVNVKSGLPATTSKERLELLDDEEHIFSVRIVGGDHRLKVPPPSLSFSFAFPIHWTESATFLCLAFVIEKLNSTLFIRVIFSLSALLDSISSFLLIDSQFPVADLGQISLNYNNNMW
ncbi:abscisic acid receptor PYL8-like isoform X1 [Salvia miltiorrhiza]|uniref:abscisic acid receptor PYL8-like isoform X1 n=1 Tax=Salvia miltiorrhiza TaxID=226208 RepID=UPI0025AC48BD|nr:abscisic acid receptor PYL8-like isoform X1 [Salvia miltiorrhiza]